MVVEQLYCWSHERSFMPMSTHDRLKTTVLELSNIMYNTLMSEYVRRTLQYTLEVLMYTGRALI